ncbi:unnamed protein product, partial [Prunus brigantina]
MPRLSILPQPPSLMLLTAPCSLPRSIIRSLPCSAMVMDNHLQMQQDMDTRRVIGLGKHFDGLYYLTPRQNPHLTNHIHHTTSLWHRRLGHPSS